MLKILRARIKSLLNIKNVNFEKDICSLPSNIIGDIYEDLYFRYRIMTNEQHITELLLKNRLEENFVIYDNMNKNIFKILQVIINRCEKSDTLEEMFKKILEFKNLFVKASYIYENSQNKLFVHLFNELLDIYLKKTKSLENNEFIKKKFLVTKVFLDIISLNLINEENQNDYIPKIEELFRIMKNNNQIIFISSFVRIHKYTKNKEIKKIFEKYLENEINYDFYDLDNPDFKKNYIDFINDIARVLPSIEEFTSQQFFKNFQNFFMTKFINLVLNPKIKLDEETTSRFSKSIRRFPNFFNGYLEQKKKFFRLLENNIENSFSDIKTSHQLMLIFFSMNQDAKGNRFDSFLNYNKIMAFFKEKRFFKKFSYIENSFHSSFYSFLKYSITFKKGFIENQTIISQTISDYMEKVSEVDTVLIETQLPTLSLLYTDYYFALDKKSQAQLSILLSLIVKSFLKKDINYHKPKFVNQIAKFCFSIKNSDKNFCFKELETILVNRYVEVPDLERFIRAVEFWMYYITLNEEQYVSSNSKQLSEFIFHIDIEKLIRNFYNKSYLENSSENFIRILRDITDIHITLCVLPNAIDRRAIYRAKPIKRIYESMFSKMSEFLFKNEKLCNELFQTELGMFYLLKAFRIMMIVHSHYNLKVNPSMIIFIFNLYKKYQKNATYECLIELLECLKIQNFCGDSIKSIYFEISNDMIDKTITKIDYDHMFNLNEFKRIFVKTILFNFEEINYNKLSKKLYKKLSDYSQNNTDFTIILHYLLKFEYDFTDEELIKIFNVVEKDFILYYKKLEKSLSQLDFKDFKNTNIIFFKVIVDKNLSTSINSKSQALLDFLLGEEEKKKNNKFITYKEKDKDIYKSNVHLQFEQALKRLNIKFESEILLFFGQIDILIDNKYIIEINGNIHFMADKTDVNLIFKKKVATMFGYKMIFVQDMDFLLANDKKKFIKEIFQANQIPI